MSDTSPLEIGFYPHWSSELHERGAHLLRLAHFTTSTDSALGMFDVHEVGSNLLVPALGETDVEAWFTPEEVTKAEQLQSDDPRIRIIEVSSASYTYLRFMCEESHITNPNSATSELCDITISAYRQLFGLIHTGVLPQNIARMWNFVPGILAHDTDLRITDRLNSERYRQFNAGRQQAWRQFSGLGSPTKRFRAPAATGIGSLPGGPLTVEVLLTNDPVVDIDNPRQLSPDTYSSKYGTLPPLFSRATAQLLDGDRAMLFIAGTASIVGEDTLHENDPSAQTHETFRNLEALIHEANLSRYLSFVPNQLEWSDLRGMRVHVRYPEHLSYVRQVVESYVGQLVVCYVQDEICRPGLLVEIETNGIPLQRAV